MSSPRTTDASLISYQLEEAMGHLKRAQNIMLELEVINYKVLGDFTRIRDFLREEISIEKEG